MLVAGPVMAQGRALGMDGQTCATWNSNRSNELVHAGELLWLLGYVSGAARASGQDFLRDVDFRLIDTAMTVHCASNLRDSFETAAANIVTGLRK